MVTWNVLTGPGQYFDKFVCHNITEKLGVRYGDIVCINFADIMTDTYGE